VIAAAATLVASAQAAEKWRHGIVEAKGDSGFLFMAAEGGFAAKHGLDLQMVQFVSGTTPLKALISGDLDSFEASPVVALSAMHLGADVKIIGCDWPGMTYTLFTQKGIDSVQGLKGKTVGVSAPGSLPYLFARESLRAAGLSNGDVKFANAGGSADRVKAVAAGVVAATASSSEFEVEADKYGVKPLLRGPEIVPKFTKVCMMSTGKKIAARRKAMEHFLAASMEGIGHALKNRDAMVTLARKIGHLPPEDRSPEFIYDEAVKYNAVSADLAIPKDNLQWVDEIMVKDGALDSVKDVSNFIDDSVRTEALKLVNK
jgi:NitT/TauT family transport system substrate-binding protein